MHWINFPLLFLMIYSGILIYWADSQYEALFAHRVYRIGIGNWTLFRLFPTWFYDTFHLKFQLARPALPFLFHVVFRRQWPRIYYLQLHLRRMARFSPKQGITERVGRCRLT